MIKNIITLSNYLGIPKEEFEKSGAIDSVIGIDLPLFIDSALLRKTTIPELKNSYESIKNYFGQIFEYIEKYIKNDDEEIKKKIKKTIISKLEFKETPNTFLGVSKGWDGKGVGNTNAKKIFNNAVEVFKLGINDPVYFELLPVFGEGLAEDRSSDMIIQIIKSDLLNYTKRIAHENKIDFEEKFKLKGREVYLIPKEIVDEMPLSLSIRDEEDNSLKRAATEKIKEKILDFRKSIDWFRSVIEKFVKNSEKLNYYDFIKDPLSISDWIEVSENLSKKINANVDVNKSVAEKTEIFINNFKYLIEEKGLNTILFSTNNEGKVDFESFRKEKFAQKLLYGTAFYFCESNNIDLNAETNSGVGYVDFKTSRGNERAVIELKIARDIGKLKLGYSHQLEKYKKSERDCQGFYVVIGFNNKKHLENIEKFKEWMNLDENRIETTKVIFIDASPQRSASKLTGCK